MIQFNPDGSVKLPGKAQENKDRNEYRMRRGRCMRIKKDVVSTFAPKKCVLKLRLSNMLNASFIEKNHEFFKLKAETPTSLTKISDDEFEISIGSDFRRCSDCNRLVKQYREALDGNVILDEGTCTLKKRDFCYEDHFD